MLWTGYKFIKTLWRISAINKKKKNTEETRQHKVPDQIVQDLEEK